jgi:nucleotide-binding universal stress UspA family protein
VAHSDTADGELVEITTQGHSPWRQFPFGSVADRVVARSAACPVLTVKADASK